jgi:hypothetical protein
MVRTPRKRRQPDTVADRAVNITMRRRALNETVLPFRVARDVMASTRSIASV